MSVHALQAKMPAPRPKGYSLAELRDAARVFGLPLIGVKLPQGNLAPDRPALAFLKLEDRGHFLVIRPVGHSGKLVQVIDSIGDPVVIDAVDLYASNVWTGLALIPVRPSWPIRIALGLMIVLAFSIVLLLAVSWSRLFKAGSASPPVSTDLDRMS